MKKISKVLGLSTLAGLSVLTLAACGSGSSSDKAKTSDTKVKTINVAISGNSNPYEYTVDGKLTGFEYDILQQVDKDLKQYKFSYKVYEDSAILTALDGGRAQLAANNFGKTKAREEKYLFTSPLSEGVNAIFSSSKDNLKEIAQLGGKKTEIPTGTNYGDIMTGWNEKHPDKKITVGYSTKPLSDRLSEVASGQIDFLFASKSAAENLVKQHAITGVVDSIPTDLDKYSEFKTYEYFMLEDTQTQLQKDLNKELKKMQEDGSLKKLSEKYFGTDQVPDADQFK